MDRASPFALIGGSPVMAPLLRLLEHVSGLARMRTVDAQITQRLGAAASEALAWLSAAEEWLDLHLDLPATDVERVPKTGSVIVAAEHPTGAMEGIVLLALLLRRRPDVKVVANRWLTQVPALRSLVLPVDVYGTGNRSTLRSAMRHLRSGGLLLVFPSGEVARRSIAARRATESSWQESLGAMQRRTEATVVPIHVAAHNPRWFHLAGTVHRHLRTALLPRALLAQRGQDVALRIGHPILPSALARFERDDRARCDYLRLRTEILARRVDQGAAVSTRITPSEPVAPRGDVGEMLEEISALPEEMLLLDANGMRVFCAPAQAIPRTLLEIGRLREITFRAAGEGSGASRDLDAFDHTYSHLFVWSPTTSEIVGAYRIGRTDELLAANGPAALYTSSFYEYSPRLWDVLSPALELGRSFVRPEYQKSYSPLLLLWRGIGAFVAANPKYRRLFGTVSISADHNATSVHLMVDHLRAHCLAAELAPFVRSRRPWSAPRGGTGPSWVANQIADLQDVSAMVRELEVGRSGIPVLMEQYLRLGARLLGVNVDPAFHTIDALLVVDLLAAPDHLQKRYLGPKGMTALQEYHGRNAPSLP